MTDKIRELRQERARLIAEARSVYDTADQQKRDMTGEEQTRWHNIMAEIDKLDEKIKMEERMSTIILPGGTDPLRGNPQEGRTEVVNIFGSAEYRSGFDKFMRYGMNAQFTPEEQRALSAGVNADGGFTVVPEQFVAELIKGIDNDVFIRQFATKFPLASAASLGVPNLAADIEDADWTTELATGNEGNMTFGKRELKPNPLAKRIKVSNKLLRQSSIPIEQLVRERLQYKFAVSQEKAFMTGDGVGKPLGIFTVSANGISAARDRATGNTATSIQYDGLIEAKFALKGQYLKKARWIFHRDAVKQVMKLKDGTGNYILDPNSPTADTILDLPYHMSEYAPNTFTTGLYAGALGDFSHYWIADALDMQIQRLVELYAEANQTGFIGRLETDGQPVLEEAFVRVKLG